MNRSKPILFSLTDSLYYIFVIVICKDLKQRTALKCNPVLEKINRYNTWLMRDLSLFVSQAGERNHR